MVFFAYCACVGDVVTVSSLFVAIPRIFMHTNLRGRVQSRSLSFAPVVRQFCICMRKRAPLCVLNMLRRAVVIYIGNSLGGSLCFYYFVCLTDNDFITEILIPSIFRVIKLKFERIIAKFIRGNLKALRFNRKIRQTKPKFRIRLLDFRCCWTIHLGR